MVEIICYVKLRLASILKYPRKVKQSLDITTLPKEETGYSVVSATSHKVKPRSSNILNLVRDNRTFFQPHNGFKPSCDSLKCKISPCPLLDKSQCPMLNLAARQLICDIYRHYDPFETDPEWWAVRLYLWRN